MNSARKLLTALIVGSLAGDLSDADCEAFLSRFLTFVNAEGDQLGGLLTRAAGPGTATVLRDMWQTPRGRELARRIAFFELSYPEMQQQITGLAGVEFIRRGVGPAALSQEDEEVCLTLVGDVLEAYGAGRLTFTQFGQLALAWKGTANFLGWGGVAPGLPPSLRGPLAFVMGLRYERLGKRPDAVGMFKTAAADAPPGSPLERLARDRLASPATRPATAPGPD